MHKTKSGRWQPDKPKPVPVSSADGNDTELAGLQAYCRQALEAGIQMPWWYPLMHFQAAVGRLELDKRDQDHA